jgi:hypothetical protein
MMRIDVSNSSPQLYRAIIALPISYREEDIADYDGYHKVTASIDSLDKEFECVVSSSGITKTMGLFTISFLVGPLKKEAFYDLLSQARELTFRVDGVIKTSFQLPKHILKQIKELGDLKGDTTTWVAEKEEKSYLDNYSLN